MADYNIANRIEELCNTLENALVELDEYKDDPDIAIRTQICDEDIFPSLDELKDIFENTGTSTLTSAVIALSDYKSAADIPEGVQKGIIKAFGTTAVKGGGLDVFAESVQKAISDLEPIYGASDESIEKIAQIVKDFLSDFGEAKTENRGIDGESKYSAISQVFKEGCGDVINTVNDVLTRHLDDMPENEKVAMLESPAGKEIFSYETKTDGSIDMDTVKARSGMQINDNGSFTDKFGISFSGEMKAKVDIDHIDEAKEGIKDFAQLLNNLYKAQNGLKYIDEKCLGPVERNALARAIHLFADDLYKKGEDSNVDNSLKKYGNLLQSLYSVNVNPVDIEKIKEADFVEKFFDKEDIQTSSDDISDKTDSDSSGFRPAEHDFTVDNTTEEVGSRNQPSNKTDMADKAAFAEQHGKSILWAKTGDENVDRMIDKRNAYIEKNPLFPIYRSNIGFTYTNMKIVIAARNKGLEINGRVPTSFDCALAINGFLQTNLLNSIALSLIEGIFDLVSGPAPDKVDKDPKPEKIDTDPDRNKNIDNSKAEERKEVEKENLKDAIVKQVSKIEQSFKSGQSNNNTKYIGRACTSSMENIINLYGKEKGIEEIKGVVTSTMEAVRKNPSFSDKTIARMEVLFEKSYLKIDNERIDLGEIFKEAFDKDPDKADKSEDDKADDDKAADASKDTADQEGEENLASKTEPDAGDDADNDSEDKPDTEPEDKVDETSEDQVSDDPRDETDSESENKNATDQDDPKNDAASSDSESVSQKAQDDEPVDSTVVKEKDPDVKSDNEKDVSSKDKVDKPENKKGPALTKEEQMLKSRLNEILSEKTTSGKVGNDGELKRIIGNIQKSEGKQNISDPVAKVIASIQKDKPDVDQGKIKAVCKGLESISKADGVSVKIKNVLSKAADVLKNPSSYAVSPTVALQWELQDKFSDYIKSKVSLGEVKDKIRSCFEKTENPDGFLRTVSNAIVNVVASLADRISSGEKAVFSRINNIMNSISAVTKTPFDKVCAALEKYGEPIKMDVEMKSSGLTLVSVDKDKAAELDKTNKDSVFKEPPDKASAGEIDGPGFNDKEEAKEEIKDRITQMALNMSDVLKKDPGERTSVDNDTLSKPSASYFETALNILKAYGEDEGKTVIREGVSSAVAGLIGESKVSKEVISGIGNAIDKNNSLYLSGNKIEFVDGISKGIELYRMIQDPLGIAFPQNDLQQGVHDKILAAINPDEDKTDKDPTDKADRDKDRDNLTNEKDLESNSDKFESDNADQEQDVEHKADNGSEDPKDKVEQEPEKKDLDKEDSQNNISEEQEDNPDNENVDTDKTSGDVKEGLDNEDHRPVDQEQSAVDQDSPSELEQPQEAVDKENPDEPNNSPDSPDNEADDADKPDDDEFEKKNGGDIDSSLETPQAAAHEAADQGTDDAPDEDDLEHDEGDISKDTDIEDSEKEPLEAESVDGTTASETADFDDSDLAGAIDSKESEEPSEETSSGMEDGNGTQGFADNVDSASPDMVKDMESTSGETVGQDIDGISDAIAAYTENADFGFSDFLDTPITINGDEMTLGEAYENDAISNEDLANALADAISDDASNILESNELMETYSDLLSDLSDMCGNSFTETFCDAMDPFASVDETVESAFDTIAEDMASPDFTVDSMPDFDVMDLAEMEFDIMDTIDAEGIIGDGVDTAMQNDIDTGLDNGLNDALDLNASDLTNDTTIDLSPDLSQDNLPGTVEIQTPDTSYMDNQEDFSTTDNLTNTDSSVPDIAADVSADALDYAELIL